MLQKTGKKILFFSKVIIFFLFIGGLYYLKNNDEFWFNLGFVLEKSAISGVAYSDELEISRKLQTSKGKIIHFWPNDGATEGLVSQKASF